MKTKEKIISGISSFPTLPVMVNRLLAVLGDPESAAKEISRIIQIDPALTANVLKAANSSFLGFNRPVTSLAEATFRLGTKWIYQIALSSLIYSNLKKPAPGYDLSSEGLWRHSTAVAIMSESLCTLSGIRDAGTIYTAGLLHDIGKIAMSEFVAGKFDEIQELVNQRKLTFEEAELEILGIDHSEVGAIISEHWHFPELIVNSIRWHHNPDSAPQIDPSLDIVHVADSVCLMEGFGLGRDDLQYRLNENSINRLSLSVTTIELAISQTILMMEQMENLFKEIPSTEAVRR
ncbi:putative HDIG domain protein [Candidatus Zixiibacteriota bacterium]|nr:putative HDIG domain protein [candidate division Zixibacteria bacterium]